MPPNARIKGEDLLALIFALQDKWRCIGDEVKQNSPFSPPSSSFFFLHPAAVLPANTESKRAPFPPRCTMMKKTSGKKKASGAAAATATDTTGDLKKVHGNWQRSSVTERQLEALRRDGHMPSLEKMKTRAPEIGRAHV